MNKGFYELKITGKDPRRFLKVLYKLNLPLYQIDIKEKELFVKVDEETYHKIKKIKTIYKITITKRTGFLKLFHQIKTNALFLVMLTIGLFVLLFLSHLTFDVEVVHSKKEIRTLILNELEEEGIKKLHLQVSFEKQEQIVKRILEKHKDKIEWLEIERIGTKYIVKVEERKIKEFHQEGTAQNVIAKKDGMILKIDATKGEIVKKKNDYVKKGDVLITGIIKNQDQEMAKVRAEGTVFAETWYQSTVEMPLHYKEESLTGKTKNRFQIRFLSHTFSLFDFNPFQQKREQNITIVKNPLLPISIEYSKQKELFVIDEIYTKEQAVAKATLLASEKLKKTLGERDEIIFQKTLKIVEKESKIIVDVFFKVSEDITDHIEIPLVENEEQE